MARAGAVTRTGLSPAHVILDTSSTRIMYMCEYQHARVHVACITAYLQTQEHTHMYVGMQPHTLTHTATRNACSRSVTHRAHSYTGMNSNSARARARTHTHTHTHNNYARILPPPTTNAHIHRPARALSLPDTQTHERAPACAPLSTPPPQKKKGTHTSTVLCVFNS